jgi:hypothetical protein
MKHVKLGSITTACASLALVVACAGGAGDANSPLRAPGAASRVLTSVQNVGDAGNGVANQGEVEVCKYGTDAQFSVVVGAGSPTVFDIADGACKVVALDLSTNQTATSVTVTEVASSSYALLSVQRTLIQFETGTQNDIVGSPTNVADGLAVPVNAFHGALLVYHNEPVTPPSHCTYTQGWYKNHTDQWPAGSLTPNTVFDGGLTIIALFNTPPKGSQYIILAHQYLTALLNVQGGSSVPPAVQTALNTAADYFNGGGAGTGDPSVDITGIATILDNYNNGLTGPGHCD